MYRKIGNPLIEDRYTRYESTRRPAKAEVRSAGGFTRHTCQALALAVGNVKDSVHGMHYVLVHSTS